MCLSPLHIERKLASGVMRVLDVPCGVCPECLKKRQSGIVVRSYIEGVKHLSICMFTLTYNDSRVPVTEDGELTLRREDIKNWKKEFRKLISNRDFAWLCCGEYGPRTHRPHYHGLFYGVSDSDLKIIENCWSRYGFTVFKKVKSLNKDILSVSRYVAKYIVKDSQFKRFSDYVESPRIMASIGFGLPDERVKNHLFCFDLFDYDPFDASTITPEIVNRVLDRLFFTIDGFRYSVPSYLLKKFFYVKNSSGSLRPCALFKMVRFVAKFRNNDVRHQELQRFCALHPERTYYQNLVAFDDLQASIDAEKSRFERENILSTYKKSVI